MALVRRLSQGEAEVMNSSVVGTLWTDYGDEDSEAYYEASVTRFILRQEEILFEFSGHDTDEGPY